MNTTHENNFDFIRFLAATMVWYSHCYALSGLSPDPLTPYIAFKICGIRGLTFGDVGITTFFIISGYFVTASYDHHKAFVPYCINRSLRLFPALIVLVLFSIFILGPCVTPLTLHEYFNAAATWRYLKTILVFPITSMIQNASISPVFSLSNGSLWSLPYELRCYIAVALLGMLGVLRSCLVFALLFCLCLIEINQYFLASSSELFSIARLSSQFTAGALLYLARDRVRLKGKYFLLALLLFLFSTRMDGPEGPLLFDMTFAYIVIYLGFLHLPLLSRFSRFGDYSYGMYLYGFPMQLLLLRSSEQSTLGHYMAVSFALMLLCAILSWHLVEKPALSLKR